MAGEKTGEVILLIWEGDPEDFFVKGHLTEEEVMDALNHEELLEKGVHYFDKGTREWDWQWHKPKLGTSPHRYGRWSMEPGPDDCSQTLRDYSEPGRGRFPVTKIPVIEWVKIDSPVYMPEREVGL